MSDLRESELLRRIERSSAGLPAAVLIGPGDDMALIELGGRRLLAAVDQVVEGRHFTSGTDEALVARKALGRNLSDVAAMAAKPIASLAACTLPSDWSQARAERLFDAMRAVANEWQCPLIGGDIAVHRAVSPLTLAVTILAEPWSELPDQSGLSHLPVQSDHATVVRRRAACAGDGVFVTGRLGGSLGADGLGRHLTFEPRVHEARSLLEGLGTRLHAMIDVSDGLGRDAAQLVDGSLQVVLDASLIPCNDGCAWRRALADGEDHELCFAAAGEVPSLLAGRQANRTPVTRIGIVRTRSSPSQPACVIRVDESELDASQLGWEHHGGERSDAN